MKVGDIVFRKLNAPPSKACSCSRGLEVMDDLGDLVKVQCIVMRKTGRVLMYTVRKDHFRVIKTLLERLEENDLNPVLGTNR